MYNLCHLKGSFPNFTFEPLPQDADGYFVTDHDSLISVDPKTGACKVYAVVETEGTEVVGYSGRVMLFRQLTYDASSKLGQKPQNRIDKIEVQNEYGSFILIREENTNNFYIDGYETTAYSLESFASLANACGYTLSMERLADPERNPDGTIRFAEYGLIAETRKDEEGKEYDGEVKSLTDFGAFVDLGGVDGMVHTSELSWRRVKHPSEVVAIGDKIHVYVKAFDREKGRISLGYKTEEMNPWYIFTTKYAEGDVAEVKVVSLMPFGAFAEIVPGCDGLIHISQITDHKIAKPDEVLEVGQVVTAKITSINNENHQVGLSIRALLEEAEDAAEDAE